MSTEKINYTTEQKSAYFVYKNLVLFANINDEHGSLINLNKEKSRAIVCKINFRHKYYLFRKKTTILMTQ